MLGAKVRVFTRVINSLFFLAPRAQTNLQHGFVILLGFIHIFLIAIVIGSVEGFMSHLNHHAEQLRRRIMHLNR